MADMFTFQDLKVWHKSVEFAEKVIKAIDDLDMPRKYFRLIEQLESASTSVSMNIAEGKGRKSSPKNPSAGTGMDQNDPKGPSGQIQSSNQCV